MISRHLLIRVLINPCALGVWILLGFVMSNAFRGIPRGVFMNHGSHFLCSHENPVLSASADYIFAAVLFLPSLIYAFKPQYWLLFLQLALVVILIGWCFSCFVAWGSRLPLMP